MVDYLRRFIKAYRFLLYSFLLEEVLFSALLRLELELLLLLEEYFCFFSFDLCRRGEEETTVIVEGDDCFDFLILLLLLLLCFRFFLLISDALERLIFLFKLLATGDWEPESVRHREREHFMTALFLFSFSWLSFLFFCEVRFFNSELKGNLVLSLHSVSEA